MLRKLLVSCALVMFASSAYAQYRHVSLKDEAKPLPQKVLIIPADVLVRELSAGGMLEKMPEWTKVSSDNLTKGLREHALELKKFTIVETPQLSADEQDALDQALATFMTVGVTAHNMLLTGGPAWQHKRQEFDYTLGPTLSFLKKKTGADAALIVAGDDIVSSGGRKAAVVVGALLGVAVPTGRSIAVTSMVDLDTGNLLWMHYDESGAKDLKDYPSAKGMMGDIIGKYPTAR